MAERGAQFGNQNACKNKPWREMLDRAIKQDDGKRLRKAAEALLDAAAGEYKLEESQLGAIKELTDRLDGKAHQTISGPEDRDLIPSSIEVKHVGPGNGTVS